MGAVESSGSSPVDSRQGSVGCAVLALQGNSTLASLQAAAHASASRGRPAAGRGLRAVRELPTGGRLQSRALLGVGGTPRTLTRETVESFR